MRTEENGLKELLENARQQLIKPFAKTRRTLLFLLNISYLVLIPTFLISEKLATGHYVPHPILGWVYALVGVANMVSAVYNLMRLRDWHTLRLAGFVFRVSEAGRVDETIRWVSVVSILIMSFCHMSGLGNPSSDAIITDFALGHSLIVCSAILLNRKASFGWFLIVLGLLIYASFFQKGYSYQYNYLTPTESARYMTALEQNKPWALGRQKELRQNSLNPPTVSRYFNTWLIFILVAFLVSYFCMGITLDVFKVIPGVTEEIKVAIDATSRAELDRQRERNQAEEQRLLLRQETLSAELKALKAQINPHFLYNTLNYFYIKSQDDSPELAEAVLKLADIMRYSMHDDRDRVGLDEEITYMKQFIDLHQLRNRHKLFIDFSVTGPTGKKEIPPFLLIGLVENAFKHGKMNEAEHPLIIRIEATSTAFTLYSINKKNRKQRVESNQIGLTNLRRRLALTYDQNYSFDIDQDEDFFRVQLTIKA